MFQNSFSIFPPTGFISKGSACQQRTGDRSRPALYRLDARRQQLARHDVRALRLDWPAGLLACVISCGCRKLLGSCRARRRGSLLPGWRHPPETQLDRNRVETQPCRSSCRCQCSDGVCVVASLLLRGSCSLGNHGPRFEAEHQLSRTGMSKS